MPDFQGRTVFGWRDPVHGLYHFAGAYERSACILAERLVSAPTHEDTDALPVIALYRHSVELYLKAILGYVNGSFPLEHNVAKLFELVKVACKDLDPEDNFELCGPRVEDFANYLGSLDPSTTSRYPMNTTGKHFDLEDQWLVDIEELMNDARQCLDELRASADWIWENRS